MATIEHSVGGQRVQRVALEGSSYMIGSDPASVNLPVSDRHVSRVHAALERVGNVWLVRDVGSRNGTMVNGERLTGQRRLRDGDEVLVGRTRFVFRDSGSSAGRTTDALLPPPSDLTRGERRVLVELCRPLLSHNAFQPPASVREIAARLFIGKGAVQAHLTNLYAKFGIYESSNRRVALANEAVQRGAVTIADLRAIPPMGDKHE